MRRKRSYSPILLLLLLFPATLSYGQSWSGILAPTRATDWTQAGVPGGIPSSSWSNCTTTACNTAYSTPSTANINAACASASANTVVRIPAGTVTLSGAIHCNVNSVVLRGAGPTQTTIRLNGYNLLMGNGSGGQGSTPSGLGSKTLSTYTKGSTVLTISSTTGLSAGQIVAIVQQNPAWVNPTGNEGNENAVWCVTPSLNFFGCSNYSWAEMVKIQSVDSSTQVTLAAPGLIQGYSSGLNPTLIYWSTSGVYSYDGIENMKIDAGTSPTSDMAVALVFCNYCWVKNVAVVNAHRAGIYSFFGYRNEIRDSYVSASNTAGAPTEYGIEVDRSSLTKIENNIEFGVTTPFLMESSSGLVAGYNYTLRTPSDNVFPSVVTHRANVYGGLYEGNISVRAQWDFVWGSASHGTAFRNYFSGTEPNGTNYRTPVTINAYNRYINVVGNVLGDSSYHTAYQCTLANNTGGADTMIYDLGWYFDCVNNSSTSYDSVVESSLMRWGNWDAVTWKANGNTNGVRWCTGSKAGNPACTASETASTDPTFPGLASPGTSLPASFYLTATPAWFGNVPWPPIGPDVNCTSNCVANTANHAAMIPAQLCYQNGAKDANGFLTAFDANVCYYSSSSGLPAPASGLSLVVH